MINPLFNFKNNDRLLPIALGFSLLLHTVFIAKMPHFSLDAKPQPNTLVVEIVQPEKPITPPKPPEPEPPKPEAPKPKLDNKPIPTPPPQKSEVPPPNLAPEPSPPPPQVIAVAPSPIAEAKPAFVAPPPIVEPPPKSSPDIDYDSIRADYVRTVSSGLAKSVQYPKRALDKGWTGVAKIEVMLDAAGKVLSSKIKESTSYDILDKKALDIVNNHTFPQPPEAMVSHAFVVPISFKLNAEQ